MVVQRFVRAALAAMLICWCAVTSAGEAAASTYMVPVAPELAAYASFTLSVTVSQTDGVKKIQYNLPPELVGAEPLTIVMTAQPESTDGAVFDGVNALARCN